MKKIYISLLAILFAMNGIAQAPEKMSYQAVVRNMDNALVTNQSVGMQVSILQGSITGVAVYEETQTPIANVNGLVSIEIGTGTIVSGTFNTIDWTAGPYFIKTETDPVGGTNYTISGTSQLMSVPYALYAKTSGSSTPGPQGETGPTGPQGPPGPSDSDWETASGFVYNTTENVGIGTDSPVVPLHLESSDEMLRLNSTSDNRTMSRWYALGSPRMDFTTFSSTGGQLTLYDGSGTYSTRVGSNGDSYFRFSNVGFGHDTPDANVDIVGTMQYVDGTEGDGKVLTSDASGNASWQAVTGGDSDWETASGFVYNTTENVGIGTDSPVVPLHLESSDEMLRLNSTSDNRTMSRWYALGSPRMDFTTFSSTGGQLTLYDGSGTYSTRVGSNGDSYFRFSNVGFGHDTPDANVDIVGTMQYVDGTEGDGKVLTSDASGNASWQAVTGGDSDWETASGFVYNTTENVGIGTDSPVVPLHLESSDEMLRLNSTSDNRTMSRWYALGSPRMDFTTFSSTGGQLTLYDGSGTYSTRVGSNGDSYFRFSNVGFGHDTPDANVDIVGTMQYVDGTEGDGKVLTSDASGNASWQAVTGGDSDWETASGFVYNTTENVGIGTDSPVVPLHLESSDEMLRLNSTSDNRTMSRWYALGSPRMDFTTFSSTGGQLTLYDGSGTYSTRVGSNGDSYFRFSNVGFGHDTPDANVDIVGTMQYVDGTEGDGKVLTSDASGNASWGTALSGPEGPIGPQGPQGEQGPQGPAGNDGLDDSVTNEIQTLSISNDTLFLSDGGSAILPTPISAIMTDQVTRDLNGDTWQLGPQFAEVTGFRAGSKVKIDYSVPNRGYSTNWGGLYIEPQISFDGGSTWESLGSCGYDGNTMSNGSSTIATYSNSLLIDSDQETDFSVTIRLYYKPYAGFQNVVNGNHDINNVSGTAPLMSGDNSLQHYTKVILTEIF